MVLLGQDIGVLGSELAVIMLGLNTPLPDTEDEARFKKVNTGKKSAKRKTRKAEEAPPVVTSNSFTALANLQPTEESTVAPSKKIPPVIMDRENFTLNEIATLLCLMQRTKSVVLNDVLVRSNVFDNKPALFKIARNTWEKEKMKNLVQVPLEPEFCYKMRLFCYRRDPRFCVFYDFLGNIAGVQISFLKADYLNVSPHIYNFTAIKDFVNTCFFDIPAYSSRIFFTHPDRLTEAGRLDTSEVAEGLWTMMGNKLVHISRCRPDGPKTGTRHLQGCHLKIGTTFVNNLSPFDTCKEGYFLFTHYHQKSLVVFGVFVPGFGSAGPQRDWYVHASEEKLKLLLPAPPPCIDDMKGYNFTAVHVYLTDKHEKITC